MAGPEFDLGPEQGASGLEAGGYSCVLAPIFAAGSMFEVPMRSDGENQCQKTKASSRSEPWAPLFGPEAG